MGGCPGLLSKDEIDGLGTFALLGVVYDNWFAPNSSSKLALKLLMPQLQQYQLTSGCSNDSLTAVFTLGHLA